MHWSCQRPIVHCVERLRLIDVVGDAHDTANPNFGLLAMSRAARLAAFAEGHVARKLLTAWRDAVREEKQRREDDEERHQLEQREEAFRRGQRTPRSGTHRALPRILVFTAAEEPRGTTYSLGRFDAVPVSSAALQAGVLETADVLVLHGGVPQTLRRALKPAAQALRAWLANGGRLLTICAGTVVSSACTKRGLGLLPQLELCNDNAAVRAGLVGMASVAWQGSATATASALGLALPDKLLHYNGPILKLKKLRRRKQASSGGEASVWARFADELVVAQGVSSYRSPTDCHETKADARARARLAGHTEGRAAAVAIALEGGGRALCFGPHPEVGDGSALEVALHWLTDL